MAARRKKIIEIPKTEGRQDHVEVTHKTETDTLTIEGVGTLTQGTLFSVKGEHGRFKFQNFTTNERNGATWIESYGGIKGHNEFRAFRVERIRRIERNIRNAEG